MYACEHISVVLTCGYTYGNLGAERRKGADVPGKEGDPPRRSRLSATYGHMNVSPAGEASGPYPGGLQTAYPV